jgi:hypothetical protein
LQNQLPGQKIWSTHHSTNSIEPKSLTAHWVTLFSSNLAFFSSRKQQLCTWTQSQETPHCKNYGNLHWASSSRQIADTLTQV